MFCATIILLKAFLFFIFDVTAGQTIENLNLRTCIGREKCVPISSCETLNYNVTLLSERDLRLYLESTRCAVNESDAKDSRVCCSSYDSDDESDGQFFGKNPPTDKISGGADADLDEFRWMALLEYRKPNSSQPAYHCAGTLINHRYVLTAAHCLANNDELVNVHLGKYDLNVHENCIAPDYCAHPTVTVGIDQITIHPNYSSPINDIALIRLSSNVYYTDYIQPICLPSILGLPPLNGSETLQIAGWGKGARTSVKQKLFVPATKFEDCEQIYHNRKNYQLAESQICAGGRKNEGACANDSGGPLMAVRNNTYGIIGIISSGYNICEVKDNTVNYPIIFTRVASFESWIKKIIRP